MTSFLGTSERTAMAIIIALSLSSMATASFADDQSAAQRQRILQNMQNQSQQQRQQSIDNLRRTQDAADRARDNARRARDRALNRQ